MKKEELDQIISETDEKILDKAENVKKSGGIRALRVIAVAALFAVLLAAFAAPMMNRPGPLLPPDTTDEPKTSGTAAGPETPVSEPPIDNSTDEVVTVAEYIGTYGKFARYEPVYPTQIKIVSNNVYDAAAYDAYREAQAKRRGYYGAGVDLGPFFNKIIKAVKTEADGKGQKNAVLSPLNIYMGLALIGEISEGETQKQIFDALNVKSLEELRVKTQKIWRAHYCDDGTYKSLLANSVWMDDCEGLKFNTDKIETLQNEYYASAFSGDLQSDDFVNAFRTWLNDQTGGRLKDMIDGIKTDPSTIMLIASTVDFAARWDRGFNTEPGYFKCDGVRRSCTYLSSVDRHNDKVYFGDGYTMYCQELENNAGKMWFILPDENKTVDEIFEKIDCGNITNRTERRDFGKVTVKVPKFDISLQSDLKPALRSVGITACFESRGDFEPIIENSAAFIGSAVHGCGVKIDEKGIVGSAFTYFVMPGAAEPPAGKYEFIADRPFIFSVESDDGLPLFTGVVNRP